ncbi:hypothetical protein P7K49_010859 [Saguinus oedipus]|uniref:Uncharacterized protein n=1 Tax=Saguinus oedipus TaxID=9490 RepID=A0ABQ9VRA4_SAGOE|nr:hypothetical protein P7K49_010859 [Saguinus oedipus]
MSPTRSQTHGRGSPQVRTPMAPGRTRSGQRPGPPRTRAHLGPRRRLRAHFRELGGCARLQRPAGDVRHWAELGRGRG